jgi:voltage-gated potassium channel
MARITEERWRAVTRWPLVVASIVFIIVYSWQVIADLQGAAFVVSRSIMVATWIVFAADYLVRLWLATERSRWFVRHLFELTVVILPALRPLRLMRALTLAGEGRQTRGRQIRSRLAVYGAGTVVILIWIGSLAVLEAERRAPNANIVNFGDAVWWAFVTMGTVGYGDYYPVTTVGRVTAVLLMCTAIAIVGVVTATLSSWVVEYAARDHDDDEPATRGQARALARQIEELGERMPQSPETDR